MFKPLLAAVLVLTVSAGEVAARDERLYCAADDTVVVTSFEIEFDDLRGGALKHFKGGLDIRDRRVPEALRGLALDSSLMTQRWSQGGTISFRLYTHDYTDGALEALTVEAVLAPLGDDRFGGRYALSASSTPPGRNTVPRLLAKADGALTCFRKDEEETLANYQ